MNDHESDLAPHKENKQYSYITIDTVHLMLQCLINDTIE